MATTASFGGLTSVFDNGQPLRPTEWIRSGVLADLIRTRAWAAKTGAEPAPMIDNLVLEAPGAVGLGGRDGRPRPSAACC